MALMVSLLLPVQMKLSSLSGPPVVVALLDTEGVGVRVPDRKCRIPSDGVMSEEEVDVVVVVVATGLDWSMMVHSASCTRLSSRSQYATGSAHAGSPSEELQEKG